LFEHIEHSSILTDLQISALPFIIFHSKKYHVTF